MALVSSDHQIIYKSPNHEDIFCYTPSIVRTRNGNMIASLDLGGDGVKDLPGIKGGRNNNTQFGQGKILLSEDNGQSWNFKTDFPFWHARLFNVKDATYLIGHDGCLMIMKSTDNGYSWGDPVKLTDNQKWHASSCNVLFKENSVYLAMEKRADPDVKGWNVAGLSPIVLKGNLSGDLMKPECWTYSSPLTFIEATKEKDFSLFGISFYPTKEREPVPLPHGRQSSPMGWLETNIVQINDPRHRWYDPEQKTFHLIMRGNTAGTGYGAVLTVKENEQGEMKPSLIDSPAGSPMPFLPMPGGHLKFFIEHDPVSDLYWMCHNQATDSMATIDAIAKENERYNLPNNERHRLELSFSNNCVDWRHAGMVAIGSDETQSNNYPSMIINGDDLEIVTRCGVGKVKDNQYTNAICFQRVKDFRKLVY